MTLECYFCVMELIASPAPQAEMLSFEGFRNTVIQDYKISLISREVSLLGRREVLTGKAKFGIFGDGKEVAQVALAKYFKNGDFRSGYYRDQTFMFAAGIANVEQYFSQLFADPDGNNDIFCAGRQMSSHFVTPTVDANGNWLNLVNQKNTSADMAPTAGQMPRALGLAFASKCFREAQQKNKSEHTTLSNQGNEICFCTIGDASTSEGHFWESINAASVLQVPLAVFVWDDGYGISVPKNLQTTKSSISDALAGMQKLADTNGIDIYKVKAWDYAGMCEVFEEGLQKIRDTHTPALFHIEEVTQPQGHSTSGSHERYKSAERLEWEKNWDCIKKMREWMLDAGLATMTELNSVESEAKEFVKAAKASAWEKFIGPIKKQAEEAVQITNGLQVLSPAVQQIVAELSNNKEPLRRDVLKALALVSDAAVGVKGVEKVKAYAEQLKNEAAGLFNTYLYNEGPKSALRVPALQATYATDAPTVNAYEVLNKYFDALFTSNPKVYAFGEDVGYIGDVNQGFAGLQEKHGADRISDTGIRELTIVGQAVGMAIRGLRPIAEIQYLDYLLYGLQPLSDDVATTHYRTNGQQSCPVIIRTRGHRLEGIWHSGSPMGMIVNALRGMYVCVPRNMVQAAGMYNTLLQSNDPAIVIECLNGYRLKEKLPNNLLAFKVPLGVPEIINEGTDITIVSYGSMLRIIEEAVVRLADEGISVELIDVQTLLPFDINHSIVKSLQKTNRILFIDEDVPGGATAYMFNHVMEEQGGYKWLDASPKTLAAKAHRPAYGSDGDYFSKPNTEDVIEAVRAVIAE
jgi:pyruvate/2-oxoglutarate/acetoin dehydrogenase E1 component/TPP-dependent pyruvate/acetoin dehydrogenase alpha subunit